MTAALIRSMRRSFVLLVSRVPTPGWPAGADRPHRGRINFRLSSLAWMVFSAALGVTPQILAEPSDEPTSPNASRIAAASPEARPSELASAAAVSTQGALHALPDRVPTKSADPPEQSGSASSALLQFGILVGGSALPASNGGYIGTHPTYTGYIANEPQNITEGFQAQFSENSQFRPILGVASELQVTQSLGLEAAFLFRQSGGTFHLLEYDNHRGRRYWNVPILEDSWEIPISLKYRFQSTRLRPFVGGGIAFRLPDYGNTKARGITSVSGINIRWTKRWSISPQVRYTYWFLPDWLSSGAGGVKRNQIHFMIGLAYGL